ncbi:heavy metal-associated isoprenylated plant protein 41-like isoform X1 [Syzygium oleosum]|uniref:heavy metal-associated isoprenylated plant protein 41-like isoform X1 n=1 Tax=Syzygium oleosum TaxID=219896 RepID=UPI0011D209D1|nr:heavy metal-associated isoprenylated plant protein 41-like isoform X1 [Syzygium oleosum]
MVVEGSERTRLGSENDDEGEEEIEGWRKKWLRHYASHHQILLVGEGDFSFSSSLASAFGSASNVTATSLDHYDALIRKYKKAKSNLGKLNKRGASLLYRVDATRMKYNADLRVRKFDRIIFNFPHAGFHGKEDNVQLINMHRKLMYGFFWNASQMLRADGEVHVSHKTEAPYCHWNLEELASRNSLKLIDQTAFESKNYPGYHHKRGDGSRCDELFPLGPCSTFKFRFYPGAKEKAREVLGESMTHNNAIHAECRQIYVSPVQMPVEIPLIYGRSVQVHVGLERIYENVMRILEQLLPRSMTHVPLPRNRHIELGMNFRNEDGGIGANYRNIVQEIPHSTCYDAGFRLVPLPGLAPEQHYADVERRRSVGDLYLFQDPQHLEYLRRLVDSFGRP